MSLGTQRQGQLGVNAVEKIVLADWGARWQALDAHNDDGVDGLIFLERGQELSGQIVFAQIKCQEVKKRPDGNYVIPIKSQKLAKNLEVWRKVVGAAIVVLVDPQTLTARWVDARPSTSTTASQILVPEGQHFNAAAKGEIGKLCGTLHQDLLAQKVHTFADDFLHLRTSSHLQVATRALYKKLAQASFSLGHDGERVIFDRDGWRHITRPNRSQLARHQSFILLGAAAKIIEACDEDLCNLWSSDTNDGKTRFFQLDSMVTFPFRQTGLVRLVLKKSLTRISEDRSLKFWTLYEPRRKYSGLGVQEPRHP
ncbi:DUF4365 domain-containing protein [Aestuariibius sp. 2305UL40-4]|uniref:DUF4365 domain-containing protein n=1 Tax=Aestuariibius violaceus TaxID=3234132 RepID=UPI00347C32ED